VIVKTGGQLDRTKYGIENCVKEEKVTQKMIEAAWTSPDGNSDKK
jgi:hypothetical protein